MPDTGTQGAYAALTVRDELARALRHQLDQARQAPPADLDRLWLGDLPIGWLPRRHAEALATCLPALAAERGSADGWTWRWDAGAWSTAERNVALAGAAARLRALGLVPGWRDEAFSFWAAGYGGSLAPELFRLERAAFRTLGLRSHAAHVHAFAADGRLWCARRAASKATDPGRLDNLAAGGLPADETPLACAVRELGEEAGVSAELARGLRGGGVVETARMARDGWAHERIFVFTLRLPPGFTPRNRDGEVQEFLHLGRRELLGQLQAGQFTHEAACVIALTFLAESRAGESAD